MKYFQSCKTIDDVKVKYRELAKEHHPDRGGDTKIIQEVNLQYTEAKKRLCQHWRKLQSHKAKNLI